MRMPLLSRLIFYVLSVYLVVGAHVADYSRTHLLNARWPPHAKFHDGQTLVFSILLAGLTIYFATAKTQDMVLLLCSVSSLGALYWVSQILAILYPGTAFVDPEFIGPTSHLLGLPTQIVVDVVALSLNAFATVYAARKHL